MSNRIMKYVLSLSMVLVVGMTVSTISLKAQDPQFSQFYAASLYLNPAFTGNTIQDRVSAIYRNQWPSIPGAFNSYSVSYDRNLASLNSGVGIMVTHDKAGSGGLRYNNVAGLYSYAFRISNELMARTGVKFSQTFRNYDQSKLVFADQIIRDGASSSVETNLDQGVSYPDFSAGGMVFSKEYWIGLSFDHLNQPNQSLLDGNAKLPLKYSIHGGYKFLLEGDLESEEKTSITVAANYKAQLKWDQLDLGFYYQKNDIVLGLWYRGIPLLKAYEPGYANNDAFILLVGLQRKGMRIGYTYDITMSKLSSDTGGAHEISITYEWPRKKKKKRRRFFVPCAKF